MYYLTIGYPLMVAPASVSSGYIVDTGEGEPIAVPGNCTLLWANLLSCATSDDKLGLEVLSDLDLLIDGDSKCEVIEKCYSLRPYRQGIGSIVKQTIANGEDCAFYSVRLGKEEYCLTEFQCFVWNRANGSVTFSYILKTARVLFSDLREDELANQVFKLIEHGLIFIMK